MLHKQISIKFNDELYQRLAVNSDLMRMKIHSFVVKSVEEILDLAENREVDKVPLLVVQARTARDYVNHPPSLQKRCGLPR